MRRQRTELEAERNKEKRKNPFISFIVGGMTVVLIGCIAFSMLLYKTNLFMLKEDAVTAVANSANFRQISVQTVKKQIEQSVSDEQAANPGQSPSIISKLPDMESWYKDLDKTDWKKGSATNVTINLDGQTVPLYDGLPWDSVSGAYYYWSEAAAKDCIKYFDSRTQQECNINTASTVTYELSEKIAYYDYDGIICIKFAPPPCAVRRDWCDSFTKTTWLGEACPDDSEYGYPQGDGRDGKVTTYATPRKYCVVLRPKNESDTVLFLPAVACDAKAHTFPGGVMQTHLKLRSAAPNDEGPFLLKYGDFGKEEIVTWQTIYNDLHTIVGRSYDNSELWKFWKNCLEVYGGDEGICININRDYSLVGFVAWPL